VPIVDILLPVLLFGFNRTLVARDEDGGDER
jgi:hypothetical protein